MNIEKIINDKMDKFVIEKNLSDIDKSIAHAFKNEFKNIEMSMITKKYPTLISLKEKLTDILKNSNLNISKETLNKNLNAINKINSQTNLVYYIWNIILARW